MYNIKRISFFDQTKKNWNKKKWKQILQYDGNHKVKKDHREERSSWAVVQMVKLLLFLQEVVKIEVVKLLLLLRQVLGSNPHQYNLQQPL